MNLKTMIFCIVHSMLAIYAVKCTLFVVQDGLETPVKLIELLGDLSNLCLFN